MTKWTWEDVRELGMRGDRAELALLSVLESIHRSHVGESAVSLKERQQAVDECLKVLRQSKLSTVKIRLKELGF